jgi:hypothetical protein
MRKRGAVPFRWLLPLAQIVLCAALLWPLWPELGQQVHASLRAYGIAPRSIEQSDGTTSNSTPIVPDITGPEWRRKVRQKEESERIVAVLNGLGGIPEVLYAIVSPAHTAWVPSGMYTWIWLDISWPVLGMFFWVFAGRGIEALLSARKGSLVPRIRWWEIILALLMLAYGGGLAVAMVAGGELFETPLWRIFVVIGLMWFSFGVSIVLAGWWQRRLRRAVARAEHG